MSKEEDKDVLAAIEDAKGFLRCGGVITWEDWCKTEADSKAVLIEAAEELDAERAAMLAMAMSGVKGAARVYAKVDGGDGFVRASMLEAVGRAVERSAP